MAGAFEQFLDVVERGGAFDGHDVRQGRHDLLGGGIAKFHDRFNELAFVLVNDAFLFTLLNGGDDFLLNFLFVGR